jgi:putative lipoprotein
MNWVFKASLVLLCWTSLGFTLSDPESHTSTQLDSLSLPASPVIADRWLGPDKADHFLTSTVLTGLGYYTARKELNLSSSASQHSAVVFSLSLGSLKEIYDGLSGTGTASWKDLIADIAGTGLGLIIISVD